MAKKTFASKITKREEPISFEIFEQEFVVKDNIPTGFYLDLMAAITETQETGSNGALLRQVKPFFHQVLVPESERRFSKILDSDEYVIDMATLFEIFGFIIEETSDRPLGGSSK